MGEKPSVTVLLGGYEDIFAAKKDFNGIEGLREGKTMGCVT